MRRMARYGLLAAASLILVVSISTVGAQQQPPPQQQAAPPAPAGQPPAGGQPPAPPARPLVPASANTVANNPDKFYGQQVTVTAAVQRILSKTAFVIAQRSVVPAANPKATGELLVVVPTMQGAVDQNAYVTVFGDVVKFDAAEVAKKAKDYKLDVPQDAMTQFAGHPAIVATGVLNAAMTDLAKRLPPPMTADEEALKKLMLRIQPALGDLRKGVEGSAADVTTKNATVLKQSFTEVEAFWKKRGKTDATELAGGARKNAELIEKAVATSKWDEVKTAATALGQACQSCHSVYRERFDDGSFRIKTGSQ